MNSICLLFSLYYNHCKWPFKKYSTVSVQASKDDEDAT